MAEDSIEALVCLAGRRPWIEHTLDDMSGFGAKRRQAGEHEIQMFRGQYTAAEAHVPQPSPSEVVMSSRLLFAVVAALGVSGCTDAGHAATRSIVAPQAPMRDAGGAADDRVTASSLWNQRTRAIIGRRGGSSPNAARTFALVSVAQYDAVIAAEDSKDRGLHPSEAAAAAAASAGVLAGLYPLEQSFIDDQLAADAEYFPSLPSERDADFEAGTAVGRTVAAAVLAYAATDGSKIPSTATRPIGPGYWHPDIPGGAAQDANWGAVRPWLLTSGDQFRPTPPPDFGSPQFLTDLAEVRSFSDNRTAEELAIAQFWASGYGPGGPAGFFGSLADSMAAGEHMNERQTARTLAVLHMAIMDASIGCYDGKYFYWYVRPYQADPLITTPVGKPAFPSYPSAHSCLSSAAAGVLEGFFPAAKDTLQAMVQQAGVARIYAGLHYRFDVVAGQTLGFSVADLALRRAPIGHRPIPLN
jgi:PAP2 superfamily